MRDTLRFFELEAPTFRYVLRQAIAEGWLAPYRIYKAKTVKSSAEGGFEVGRDELDWTAMDEGTRTEVRGIVRDRRPASSVDPRALERKFTIPERNRAIVREFREVIDGGFTGRDGVRRFPSRGKTIVFAVTRRHAETLATMFDEHFRGSEAPSCDALRRLRGERRGRGTVPRMRAPSSSASRKRSSRRSWSA